MEGKYFLMIEVLLKKKKNEPLVFLYDTFMFLYAIFLKHFSIMYVPPYYYTYLLSRTHEHLPD